MRGTLLLLLIISVTLISCGLRTAPVPYEQSNEGLPVVVVNKPVFKGNELLLVWHLDKAQLDTSTDEFKVSVIKSGNVCAYCENKLIDTVRIFTDDDSIQRKNGKSNSFRYYEFNDQFYLYIDQLTYNTWHSFGLFHFAIDYRLKSGLTSEQSENVSPTWVASIIEPEVQVIQKSTMPENNSLSIILKWKRIPEYIYHIISKENISTESIKYFGLNLYHIEKINDHEMEIPNNEKPLLSGQIELTIGNQTLFGRHVDRYGNESTAVLILDNTIKDASEDGNP